MNIDRCIWMDMNKGYIPYVCITNSFPRAFTQRGQEQEQTGSHLHCRQLPCVETMVWAVSGERKVFFGIKNTFRHLLIPEWISMGVFSSHDVAWMLSELSPLTSSPWRFFCTSEVKVIFVFMAPRGDPGPLKTLSKNQLMNKVSTMFKLNFTAMRPSNLSQQSI